MTWLENARIFAIFAVIVVHVAVGVPFQADMGSALWYYNASFDVLVRWCVPVFVMVSGALLLEPHPDESLREFAKKRVGRVLIPLLFWSLLYIVWGYYREGVQEPFTVSYVVQKLMSGKPYYHMWFMYMLIGLYIFTPVYRAIVAGLKTRQLVFYIIVSFVIATIQTIYEGWYDHESNMFLSWFLMYTPYFFMGYVIRHHELPISTPKLAMIVLFFAALIPSIMCYMHLNMQHGEGYIFFKNLNALNICLSVSLMFLFKRLTKPILGAKLTPTVANLTFGIYLLHMIPMSYLYDQKDIWMSFSPFAYIPLFSFVVLVVTGVCIWVMTRIPYVRKLV